MHSHFSDEKNWQTVGSNHYFRKQRNRLFDYIISLEDTTLNNFEIEIIERKIRAIEIDLYGSAA